MQLKDMLADLPVDEKGLQTLEEEQVKKLKRDLKTSIKRIESYQKDLKNAEQNKKDKIEKDKTVASLKALGHNDAKIAAAVKQLYPEHTSTTKRNRGPAKFIYTDPKSGEKYTAGPPPQWYNDMSQDEKEANRVDNPARTKWEKEQSEKAKA